MKMHRGKQQGIALFQVLLITSILAILAIQFTQTAKNQIEIAQMIVDRANAEIALKNAETDLIFSMLTETKSSQINQFNVPWNFYNKPFDISAQVIGKIQDQHALLSVFKVNNTNNLMRLFRIMNLPVGEKIEQSILDWQDANSLARVHGAEKSDYSTVGIPTNVTFQQLNEISYVKGAEKIGASTMEPYVNLRPSAYFNPLNSPKEILLLFTSAQKVEQILKLRDNGALTPSLFSNITGINRDETLNFFTSGQVKLELNANIGHVSLRKLYEINIKPYDAQPYVEHELRY